MEALRGLFDFIHEYRAKKIQKAIKEFLRKKHENLDLVTPSNFKCPITLELFEHPVVASDGNTYEYTAILRILRQHTMKSPLTGQRLESKTLVPNLNLRSEVMEFRQHRRLWIPTNFDILNFHMNRQEAAPTSMTRSSPRFPTQNIDRSLLGLLSTSSSRSTGSSTRSGSLDCACLLGW